MLDLEVADTPVSPQWSTRCDDCENDVECFCEPCGIKFCTSCRDRHLSSRRFHGHNVVPYKHGMKSRTQSTCPDHPGEQYQLYCKVCGIPICTSCITGTHEGHKCCKIPEAYNSLKAKAISHLDLKSNALRPRLLGMLTSLDEKEAYAKSAVSEIEREMRKSGRRLVKEMNEVMEDRIKDLLKNQDEKITVPLLRDKKKIRESLNSIEKEITSYEENLRSADPVDLLIFMKDREDDDSSDIGSNLVDVDQLLPTFQPGQISRGNIQLQLGKLTLKGDKSRSSNARPPQRQDTKEDSITKQDKKRLTCVMDNMKKLLAAPVCQDQFTYNNARGIRLLATDRAWIHGNGTSRLDLVERSGKVVRTVDAGCKLYRDSGKCVTDDGNMLYSDQQKKCIRAVSPSGEVRNLFATGDSYSTMFSVVDSRPLGLCRLMSGNLAVGMDGLIRIYTRDGRDVRDIGKSQLKTPFYITTNKLTGDICVSDSEKKVVVFTEDGEYRYTYSGQGCSGNFNPCDLCSDLQGHLMITDRSGHCVHILDRNGQFIQYLATDKDGIKHPVSIDVDDQGCVWVGESNTKKVKIIKYLQ